MLHSLNQLNKTGSIWGFVLCFVFLGNSFVMANVDQIKLYKAAYPDSKPKCIFCHIDKLPKKDEGMHEHNAYGNKILETDAKPTVDTYIKVGTFEDFEAQQNQARESGKEGGPL